MSTELTLAHKKKKSYELVIPEFSKFPPILLNLKSGLFRPSVHSVLVSERLLAKTLHSSRDFWDRCMMSCRIVFCISWVPQTLLWTVLCLISVLVTPRKSREYAHTCRVSKKRKWNQESSKKNPCSWKEYFLGNSHFSYLYVARDIIVIFASEQTTAIPFRW